MSVTGHTSRTKSVSIRDVAKAAGVSYQTVSRVINGNSYVKESTRQRVQQAIAELGFRPNSAARALASGATRSLTVVTANTTLYGYAALLQGIEEAARAASFAVGISVLESDGADDVRIAVERAVDTSGSVIVIAFDQSGVLALNAVPEGFPLVAAVETPATPPPAGSPWVWIDDERAARAATRYLLELGHPTVHYVAIPSSHRAAGWRAALDEAGIAAPEPVGSGWDAQAGYRAGQRLAANPEATAIFCGNDDLALGVIRAMHEAGRSIPGDVSVVGFDNAPQSAFYVPALTTVELDFAGLGRACFAMLRDVLSGAGEPGPHPASQAELVVRESAGPYRPSPAN